MQNKFCTPRAKLQNKFCTPIGPVLYIIVIRLSPLEKGVGGILIILWEIIT